MGVSDSFAQEFSLSRPIESHEVAQECTLSCTSLVANIFGLSTNDETLLIQHCIIGAQVLPMDERTLPGYLAAHSGEPHTRIRLSLCKHQKYFHSSDHADLEFSWT